MNNIAMISQRITHANADACGTSAPDAKAPTMAKVLSNPGFMDFPFSIDYRTCLLTSPSASKKQEPRVNFRLLFSQIIN
jgi:hypothetical protein